MKHIFFITAIILLLASCSAEFMPHERIRPSGIIVTESRDVPQNINRIGVSGIIDLNIFLGDEERIEILADDNVMPHIATRQTSGNGLEIFTEGVSFIGNAPQITVNITLRDLNELHLSNASTTRLYLEQALVSDRLDIRASGATSIYFQTDMPIEVNRLAVRLSGSSSFSGENIVATTITADLSGSSQLDLDGEVRQFNLTSAGSSRARTFDLISTHLYATLSGSSTAQVTAVETLTARLSGSSRLIYDGNPIVDSQTSGASSLIRR